MALFSSGVPPSKNAPPTLSSLTQYVPNFGFIDFGSLSPNSRDSPTLSPVKFPRKMEKSRVEKGKIVVIWNRYPFLSSLKWAPIVYSTAITGQSVDNIVVAAAAIQKERSRRLSTAILNQVIREAVALILFKSPPRTRGGKRGHVYYCTRAAIRRPPRHQRFCFPCKRREAVFGYVQKIYGEAATH